MVEKYRFAPPWKPLEPGISRALSLCYPTSVT
jgi:hypothetical protein